MMAPKSLLRHQRCVSDLKDMAEESSFHRVLWDDEDPLRNNKGFLVKDTEIKRVILCSGKIYYEILEERDKREIKDIYLIRIEQLYPFPYKALNKELSRFPFAEFIWCQEEPRNMGAWTYIIEPMQHLFQEAGRDDLNIDFVGRQAAASPATGLMSRHLKEQADIINQALSLGSKEANKPVKKRKNRNKR